MTKQRRSLWEQQRGCFLAICHFPNCLQKVYHLFSFSGTALDTLCTQSRFSAGLGRNCVLTVNVTLFHNRKRGAGSTNERMKSTNR